MMKCAAQRHKEKQEECAACQFRNDKVCLWPLAPPYLSISFVSFMIGALLGDLYMPSCKLDGAL